MDAFDIRKGMEQMDVGAVIALLRGTGWAEHRSEDVIRRSMAASLCYGVFEQDTGRQVGFARAITDYATSYYLCDVVIHPDFRGQGLGKKLVSTLINDPDLVGQRALLITRTARWLYEKCGFQPVSADRTVMWR